MLEIEIRSKSIQSKQQKRKCDLNWNGKAAKKLKDAAEKETKKIAAEKKRREKEE